MQSIQVPVAPSGPTRTPELNVEVAAAERAFINSFNHELHQAQQAAIATLHDLLIEMAKPAPPRTAPMTLDEHRHAKLAAQGRSLRYRAATALLRVRPLKDQSAIAQPPARQTEGGRRDRTAVQQRAGADHQPASPDAAALETKNPDRQGAGTPIPASTNIKANAPSTSSVVAATAGTTAPPPSRPDEPITHHSRQQHKRQRDNHHQRAEAAA